MEDPPLGWGKLLLAWYTVDQGQPGFRNWVPKIGKKKKNFGASKFLRGTIIYSDFNHKNVQIYQKKGTISLYNVMGIICR